MRDIAGPDADVTATGKKHFEVLDGMRGSAALLVVLFHIMGMPIAWKDDGQLLHHAALAVDFFFALSGFVIAYAYDDRWGAMTTRQFFAARLIRLHPLVLLGAGLGLLSFVFDPFADNQSTVPLGTVLADFALACLLLPHAALPNRWTDTHSINSPAWSLLQEYIGNLVYALALRRLSTKALGAVVALAGLVLAWVAYQENSVDLGSDWDTYWMGTARMAFSFTFGLWLYRVRGRAPKIRLGWVVATIVLVVLFAMPLVPKSIPHGNGAYHLFLVMVVFPVLILGGAHSDIGSKEMSMCKLAGRMSYPIYILHYPFLLIYMNFVTFTKPPAEVAHLAGAGVFALVLVFTWLALTFYDEPLRGKLRSLIRR
jgi:peptidoglycan/LPS O-acetylase OafA/YrhL